MVGGIVLCCLLLVSGCGYRYYVEPLKPAPEAGGAAGMQVSDDGTVTFVQGRLEISVRPMTDEELNRQFANASDRGASLNPYTYGDWVDPELGKVPSRFTVFRLRVKNYMYPKVQVDPMKAVMIAQNGRRYASLGPAQLDEYYQKYITGYTGNRYSAHQERMAIARNSGFRDEPVFSGQEKDGYIVFPLLHPDVDRVELHLRQVALRFSVWGEPLEQIDVAYSFVREIGRIGPDGKKRTGR